MSYSFFQSQFPKFRPFPPFWARFQSRGKQKAGNNGRAVKNILVPNFGGRPPNPQTERKKHQSRPCYPIGTDLGTKQTRRKGRGSRIGSSFGRQREKEKSRKKILSLSSSSSSFSPFDPIPKSFHPSLSVCCCRQVFIFSEVWYLPKNTLHRSIITFDLIVGSNMGTSLPLLLLLSSLSALSLFPSATEARLETQTHNHFPNKQ